MDDPTPPAVRLSDPDYQHRFVAADEHGSMLVSLVDTYRDGRLQRQLDRIESKLNRLLHIDIPDES